MANDILSGQYSVIAPFLQNYNPAWLSGDPESQARVSAYEFYKNLYWNDAGGFRLTLRGDEEFPVYIPAARRIVNTMVRYVAKNLSIHIDAGSPEVIAAAQTAYDTLFKRCKFYSVFNAEKRWLSATGDMVFGLFADPEKPQGTRIKIKRVDPGKFFPIYDPTDDTEVWGQQIIELVTVGDKNYVHIQRWLKPIHPEHPETGNLEAAISYDATTYETDGWDDPAKRKTFSYEGDAPIEVLDGILSLPLYHFRNDWQPGNRFGTSDLAGLERIFFAINQTATDEDVSIAMGGLGMYVADSRPVDSSGAPADWVLGPKRVVEVPKDGKFDRVNGTETTHSIAHLTMMQDQAEATLGISEVALGQVDTSVAESGIALALRMGPLLDAAGSRDVEILDVLTQLLHDLKMWFLVYEQTNLGDDITGATILPVFGDKLPTDSAGVMDRLLELYTNGIISRAYYWETINSLGTALPPIDPQQMLTEIEEDQASIDPTGDRLGQEAADPTQEDGVASGDLNQ